MKKIKYSKTAINTELSTRKSEAQKTNLQIFDESMNNLSLEDIPKAALTYKGAYPYLMDALSELCTMNPTVNINGEIKPVIQGQNNSETTHFSARLKWDSLTHLATRGEPTSKDRFRKEIMSLYKNPPSMYINLGGGLSVLTHPFIIRSIFYEDSSQMSKKDAEICARLGITKKISFVEIDFFKPLFNACFAGNESGGFIYTDPAFFAMLTKTMNAMRNDKNCIVLMSRFYNPNTKQFIVKYPTTYHKFILYLLSHISSNPRADTLTLYEDEIIEMLSHVDPQQLTQSNGKIYIRNQFDTKLFFDKASFIYNQMAKYGYCEHTIAVSEHCIYSRENGKLKITLSYKRTKPRTNVETYSSNFMNELKQNAPLQITFAENDDL